VPRSSQALGYDPFTLAFARSDAGRGHLGDPNHLGRRAAPEHLISAAVRRKRRPTRAAVRWEPGRFTPPSRSVRVPIRRRWEAVRCSSRPVQGRSLGLSIVIPARLAPTPSLTPNGAGELVIRAAVNVKLDYAALTITSDPFPSALDGIPLQLRLVKPHVRPGPTS